jgi:hypothetical protein
VKLALWLLFANLEKWDGAREMKREETVPQLLEFWLQPASATLRD